MKHNIDKLVNKKTNSKSPGEKLRDTFLDGRPQSQWPPYLDETAKEIASEIAIGETRLDKQNFPSEAGPLYQKGLLATSGEYSDLPEAMNKLSSSDLARAVYLLNRLTSKIQESDTGLEDVERAVTAVLEKILSDTDDIGGGVSLDQQSNSTADILIQLLSDPAVAAQVDALINQFETVYNQGLLSKLDEPQMMTPLWNHQREALEQWLDHDRQGYVDMATATGKTVLGLAAIAAEFGQLHPRDSGVATSTRSTSGKADLLVVAHNDLILEQWRREFDRHLSIPPDRTKGSNDVDLTWGRLHFRTAQTLLNQDLIAYDLVILDEAHHYANGGGWGQLLGQFDCDILALSGSVDGTDSETSAVRDRLQSKVGPELSRYTLSEAQDDGIIPTFDWTIQYTPATVDDEFVEITEKARVRFDEFQDRRDDGEIGIDADTRLRTFDDVTAFSHTREGKQLKEEDDRFKDLVTTLFSRRTQRWNQSPEVDTVVEVAADHHDQKVVVLTNNNSQVDAIADKLEQRSAIDSDQVFTVRSTEKSDTQRDTVDTFDIPGEPGYLVGTGDLLGEGVDMRHAEVGINMATGAVNKQLIQRIGRVLRNPTGDKHATFINLVGMPANRRAQVPADDGQVLIEEAVTFNGFGTSFGNEPTFNSAVDDSQSVERLLTGGCRRITTLRADGEYDWPSDQQTEETLKEFLSAVDDHLEADGARAVFDAWSATDRNRVVDTTVDEGVDLSLSVENESRAPVEGAFVSLVGEEATGYGRTDSAGRVSFSVQGESCTVAVNASGVDTRTVDVEFDSDEIEKTISLGV